jgi:DNA-binding MarR family transcriptional regulator
MTNQVKMEMIGEILRLWKSIGHGIGKSEPGAWMGLNLTIAQLKSLLFIEFEGHTSSKKLATALGASPPNVTGIIDRLVERRLVSREENPENRRMQVLTVTGKGVTLLTQLRERRVNRLTGLLGQMNTDDLAALARGLAALARVSDGGRENDSHAYN